MSEPIVYSRVTVAAWPSRGAAPPPRDAAAARRRKAVIQALVAWAAAAVLLLVFKRTVLASVVGLIGLTTLVGGLFVPPVFHAIEHAGLKLAEWVTTGLTWLLMVPFFYLFFVPARFILKIQGKDPMRRVWDRGLATYWVDRPASDPVVHFTRQF